jgi:hypothetical protein
MKDFSEVTDLVDRLEQNDIALKTIKLAMRMYVFKDYINKTCYEQYTDKQQMQFINEIFGEFRKELVDIASTAWGGDDNEFVECIMKILIKEYKKKKSPKETK